MDFDTEERFDAVCAFQALEHNPLEEVPGLIRQMARFSKKFVYVSVPFSGNYLSLLPHLRLPRINSMKGLSWAWERSLFAPVKPVEKYRKRPDRYAPHWWEVGDKNFRKKDFAAMVEGLGLRIVKQFHNEQFPYHLFYFMEKQS